jgi:glucose dehydrogenase
MIAYKGTKNLQCKNQTYQVGETYTHTEKLEICESGFHFCEKLHQIDFHYPFNRKENIYLEIEVLGETIRDNDKCVTNKFKVLRIIPREEFHLIEPKNFDKNGNLIYQENSDGSWEKSEYDENNNEIYFENSSGYWEKRQYDENNNKIYYENSEGFWEKRQYDKNNNEIYFENSNGYWRKYEYDENNILINTTTGKKEQ